MAMGFNPVTEARAKELNKPAENKGVVAGAKELVKKAIKRTKRKK